MRGLSKKLRDMGGGNSRTGHTTGVCRHNENAEGAAKATLGHA